MIVSEYIVKFLVEKEITDVFGYPGGMVTYLMDAFDKYSDEIKSHLCYHEQAASFAACGYAQVNNKPGVAFATSGPGVTNLMTGIANAYFDSIPCIFITGQVNTYEQKKNLKVRQKGFQETEVVSLVSSITKYAVMIESEEDIPYEMEKAYQIAISGRPGPVVIDIPMNIQRADITIENCSKFKMELKGNQNVELIVKEILESLKNAKRPLILAGAGIRIAGVTEAFRELITAMNIPVVTSMIATDAIESYNALNMGFIGAYGHRQANFAVAKSDLILSLGSRLDCRQTGVNQKKFAENAKIIRIDIEANEMTNKVSEQEVQYICDLRDLIPALKKALMLDRLSKQSEWLDICSILKKELINIDTQLSNRIMEVISQQIPQNAVITTDVGQNQVWIAQSFLVKKNQKILYSGGHGAMGYSLPAAIGAFSGNEKTVVSFSGDGGFQMNIQELQYIVREKLPLKIFIVNNKALGMIRHFQEMYFNSNEVQTVEGRGYSSPCFEKIANAYGILYDEITSENLCENFSDKIRDDKTRIFEIVLNQPTYVFPKLAVGKPIYDQEPSLSEELMIKLINL